jgi:hypothetical protein
MEYTLDILYFVRMAIAKNAHSCSELGFISKWRVAYPLIDYFAPDLLPLRSSKKRDPITFAN